MAEILSIKIKIGDREYPMQTEAMMESKLRLAGKLLNEKLLKYTKHLGVMDKQDLLAMTAFDCMVELIDLQQDLENFQTKITQKITDLEQLSDL
jgi:cell division protein ZapA